MRPPGGPAARRRKAATRAEATMRHCGSDHASCAVVHPPGDQRHLGNGTGRTTCAPYERPTAGAPDSSVQIVSAGQSAMRLTIKCQLRCRRRPCGTAPPACRATCDPGVHGAGRDRATTVAPNTEGDHSSGGDHATLRRCGCGQATTTAGRAPPPCGTRTTMPHHRKRHQAKHGSDSYAPVTQTSDRLVTVQVVIKWETLIKGETLIRGSAAARLRTLGARTE